jgi:butyryl-CoA dehydrogenase
MQLAMEETKEIRELAHQFASDELRPHAERWDHQASMDATVLEQLAELGFFGMRVPETLGGMGMGLGGWAAAMEELAWGEAAIAVTVVQAAHAADVLLGAGSDAQRGEWGSAITTGVGICSALAEDRAGSDLTGVTTRALPEASGWRITGEKRWVANPSRGGLALVLASTAAGPTLFAVPTATAGWKVTRRDDTLGLRPLELATVTLNDVRVGADAVVGAPGGAIESLSAAAGAYRIGISAVAVGIARAALDHASRYAAEREQFGQAIREFQGIQFKLADMATRTRAAASLLVDAAFDPAHGRAAMAKLFASETAMWVTTQTVQIFGGYGYMRDYPVEKLMRDAKAMEILAGANEVLRAEIADALYSE